MNPFYPTPGGYPGAPPSGYPSAPPTGGYPMPPYQPYPSQQGYPQPPPYSPSHPQHQPPQGYPPHQNSYQQPYPPQAGYQQPYPPQQQYQQPYSPQGTPQQPPGSPPPGYPSQPPQPSQPAQPPPASPVPANSTVQNTTTTSAASTKPAIPPAGAPQALQGYFHISVPKVTGLSKDGSTYLLVAFNEKTRISSKTRIAIRSKAKARGGNVEFQLKSKQMKIPVKGKFSYMTISLTHDGMISNKDLGSLKIGFDPHQAPFTKSLKGTFPTASNAQITLDIHFEKSTKAKDFSSTSDSN